MQGFSPPAPVAFQTQAYGIWKFCCIIFATIIEEVDVACTSLTYYKKGVDLKREIITSFIIFALSRAFTNREESSDKRWKLPSNGRKRQEGIGPNDMQSYHGGEAGVGGH